MNHRSIQSFVALYAAAGVLVGTGCASPVDDTAERLANAPTRGGRDAGTDARLPEAATPAPVDASAPPRAAPPSAKPCDPAGPAVFEAEDTTSAHRYATTDAFPAGYSSRGVAFRLAPTGTTEGAALLYLVANGSSGDVLVSTVPTEGGADGYGPVATLGNVYLTQLPGTVPLVRYYRESPVLRHLVTTDGDPGDGFSPEPNRFYVCPR